MADKLHRHSFRKKLAGASFALSNYMAGEVINIVLRWYSVFNKYNCIENRGACVKYEIWLLGIDKPN